MDWSWLGQVLAWIVALNNTISNFAAVLGFLTILAAGGTYLIKQMFKDPFGDTYRKPPRYEKFWVSLAQKLHRRDASLVPQDIDGTASCAYRYKSKGKGDGMTYFVHFVQGTSPQVYLILKGGNRQARYKRLWDQRGLLMKRLGLTKRFLRRTLPGTLEWEPDLSEGTIIDGRSELTVGLRYPHDVAIDDDARTLKEVRKWAAQELVALKRAVDDILAGSAVAAVPGTTPPGAEVGSLAQGGSEQPVGALHAS